MATSQWRRQSDAEHQQVLAKIARQEKAAHRDKIRRALTPLSVALSMLALWFAIYALLHNLWVGNNCHTVVTLVINDKVMGVGTECWRQYDPVMTGLYAAVVTLFATLAIICLAWAITAVQEYLQGNKPYLSDTVGQVLVATFMAFLLAILISVIVGFATLQ